MVSSSTRLVTSLLFVFVVTTASVVGIVAGTAVAVATEDDDIDGSSVGTLLESTTLPVDELDDDLDDDIEETNETVNETTDSDENVTDGNVTDENVTDESENTTDSVEDETDETTDTDDAVDTDENLTDDVDGTAESDETVTDDGDDVVADSSDTLENTTDGTTETVNDTTASTEMVVETAESTTETVEDTANETVDAVEDTADETVDSIEDTTDEATEAVENTTDETVDVVEDTTTTDAVTELDTTTSATLSGTRLLETRLDADVSVDASTDDAKSDDDADESLEGTETALDGETEGNEATEGNEHRDDDATTTTDDSGSGFGSASSPETQHAVNGVLVGLLGAVAVSGMGASAGAGVGAGAGAGAGKSTTNAVASWTGSQPRRLLTALRDALPVPVEALALLRYSRYDDSDPLENDHRRTVFDTITEEPGLYLSALSDRSGVALSTVRHHVRVLEDENLLTSVKVGGKRRYFPIEADGADGMDGVGGTDGGDHERYAILAEPARRRVLEELAVLEHASNGRLAEALDLDPSTVSHHLTTLEEAGFVVRERDGRAVRNRLSEDARSALLEAEVDADSSDTASTPAPADD
ncbi:metalloregulator ArsR/SmtB family transcription factor [Saliphagus sp. GCM10025334]